MTSRLRRRRVAAIVRALPFAALVAVALPGMAQYKVTGPDGRITYTDRAPAPSQGTAVPLNGRAAAEPAAVALPLELREPQGKYPVTLYTLTRACDPCDAARQLLRQRGIPFSEKLVVSAQDSEALERLSGAREAPTLTIGSQVLKGLSGEVWNSYLDAAGYPRTSKLPPTYQYPAATPVVAVRDPAAARAAAARADATPDASRMPAPPPGIRF